MDAAPPWRMGDRAGSRPRRCGADLCADKATASQAGCGDEQHLPARYGDCRAQGRQFLRAPLEGIAGSQPDKSIAVLPFVDVSDSQDQEYFSDGLAEELIDHLTHSPELKVIARTSSFQFKAGNEDVRAIAHQLGVAHVLEGSVRKSGQQLRVTAQLIRASDGAHLWSQTYDRNLGDIFKVQDEIGEQVSQALHVVFRASLAAGTQQPDVQAYNYVLEGNYFKARRTLGDAEKAAELYQQALDINPNYALAWARLASAYLREEVLQGPPAQDSERASSRGAQPRHAARSESHLGLLHAGRIRADGDVGLGGRAGRHGTDARNRPTV